MSILAYFLVRPGGSLSVPRQELKAPCPGILMDDDDDDDDDDNIIIIVIIITLIAILWSFW